MFTKAMQKALEEDAEKLRQLTHEEHGPVFDDCCGYVSWGYMSETTNELRIPCEHCPRKRS